MSPQFPSHYGCVITCGLYQESTQTILFGLIHTCVWILMRIQMLKAIDFGQLAEHNQKLKFLLESLDPQKRDLV